MTRQLVALVLALAVPLSIGAVGGLITSPAVSTWYQTLQRPAWNPPDWVFFPVWTTLYFLMGLASWLVWRGGWGTPKGHTALRLYGVQLVLNLLWSVIFFGLKSPGWALLEILVLWALIVATLLQFRVVSAPAALLLVPYLLWVTYAVTLNAGIWWLDQ